VTLPDLADLEVASVLRRQIAGRSPSTPAAPAWRETASSGRRTSSPAADHLRDAAFRLP
jgi:hypothetical protein